MNDYGKSIKRMSLNKLLQQKNLWEQRSQKNKWFYSLPMHQAVLDEIKRRERKREAA